MLSCKASTKIDANKCNAMCHAIRAAKIGNCIPSLSNERAKRNSFPLIRIKFAFSAPIVIQCSEK